MFKVETALRSPNPVILNYGLLEHFYPVKQKRRDAWIDRDMDLLYTQVSQVKTLLKSSERAHYLFYRIPKTLNGRDELLDFLKRPTIQKWLKFNERRDLYLIDLLGWFYKETEYQSPLEQFTYEESKQVVIVLQEDNQFVSLNLSWLKEWRGDTIPTDKGEEVSKKAIVSDNDRFVKLYTTFTRLLELRSEVDVDSADGPTIWETLEQAADGVVSEVNLDTEYTTTINNQLSELVKAGRLSRRELAFLEKQSLKYQTIPNPFGDGVLGDMLDRPLSEVQSVPTDIMPEIKSVMDKTYLKSSIVDFDSAYHQTTYAERHRCNGDANAKNWVTRYRF